MTRDAVQIERALRAAGTTPFLLVTSTSGRARRCYARRGFTEIGTLHGYVVAGVDEVLMRKRLQMQAP